MEWGKNITSIPGFHMDSETLKVIQDFLYSGFHVLLSGNPGCGKTEFGQAWAKYCGLSYHKVNCGAIRSPRDWFGRWEFRKGQGTIFVPSRFIEMIEQPGLIILDEINRTTPDNHNPIMNILDGNREVYVEELNRYVHVHEHAPFLATQYWKTAYRCVSSRLCAGGPFSGDKAAASAAGGHRQPAAGQISDPAGKGEKAACDIKRHHPDCRGYSRPTMKLAPSTGRT